MLLDVCKLWFKIAQAADNEAEIITYVWPCISDWFSEHLISVWNGCRVDLPLKIFRRFSSTFKAWYELPHWLIEHPKCHEPYKWLIQNALNLQGCWTGCNSAIKDILINHNIIMTKLHSYNDMLSLGITFCKIKFSICKNENCFFLSGSVCPTMLAFPPIKRESSLVL